MIALRRKIIVAVAVLAFAVASRAQQKPSFLTAQSFTRKVETVQHFDYLLFLPRDTAKPPPLILFLHGAGERGDDLWQVTKHGPTKYIETHPEFPFVLVEPQCAANQVWRADELLGLLNEAIEKYHADPHRIYLTGLSLGGFGAWDLALNYPEKFAAVIPIAGGGSDLPIILAQINDAPREKIEALKTVAFWAFHGARDNVVPPSDSQRLVAELQHLGVHEAKLTLYPDAMHNSWERTYSNPEIYVWLLQHHR